jgi:hypothetical protein
VPCRWGSHLGDAAPGADPMSVSKIVLTNKIS